MTQCRLLGALLAAMLAWATPTATGAPLGLPSLDARVDGDANPARIALGKALFFDPRMSSDGSVSCATCHRPAQAYSDGNAVSTGVGGRPGTRNAPSLLNVAFARSLTWDGRRERLEEQVLDPLLNPVEHGLADAESAVARVRGDAAYRRDFARAFPAATEDATIDQIAEALAAYLRTLLAGDSPFDRYYYGGERGALSDAAVRGLEVFRGAGRCASCHHIGERAALLTDDAFHAPGIGREVLPERLVAAAQRAATASGAKGALILVDPEVAALGRFAVTGHPGDLGKFRTPSLRNVALTAPYMHDGSVATLEQAVEREVYYRGLEANRPLALSVSQRRDLVAFLEALTSSVLP